MDAQLTAVVTDIMHLIEGIAGLVFIICIAIAGMMRMLSFGNERRVAISNMALTAAVIGLLIVVGSVAIGGWVHGFFSGTSPVGAPTGK